MKSLKIIMTCPCIIVLQDIIQTHVIFHKVNCTVHKRYIMETQKVIQRLHENGLGIFIGTLKYLFKDASMDSINPE